jgi:16S rRNA (guanine527-N7)-methyltransferase
MHPARIAELLAPFLSSAAYPASCHFESAPSAGEEPAFISSTLLRSISTYIDILIRWNARINLTAIRDPESIVTRHFGESLFAARILFPRSSSVPSVSSVVKDSAVDRSDAGRRTPEARLADLGSGAGFPGIPIKLWAPEISLTLIESNHKKATFLREVVRALTLTEINIQHVRAETLAPAQFDLVTLRAVERFAEALPAAARLLAPKGRLALLIGSAQLPQAHAILPAWRWSEQIPIPNSTSRAFLLGAPS